jgi:hypothetical protein
VDVDALGEFIQVEISEVTLIKVEPNDDEEGEDNNGLADAALKAHDNVTYRSHGASTAATCLKKVAG